jgi:mono/diheme cytochrome c family protein
LLSRDESSLISLETDFAPMSSFTMTIRRISTANLVVVVWLVLPMRASGAESSQKISYVKEVRPILSRNCFQCHGPDEQARQGDLRLDDRASAIGQLPTGTHAIVPGKPAQSELINRITSSEHDGVMPPRENGKRLSESEVNLLRKWIEQEADYSKHWSYEKPIRSIPPTIAEPGWAKNAVDHFIGNRLDREGLHSTVTADRESLLRRVSLDLTGLPPTIEENRVFLDETRPDAFERAVDRLLSAPTFGERWGAVWLDLARYGDSQGYIHDPPRTIWRWRDWLIEALNANLPYDRFTIEMLAGDLLPDATDSQRIASGFHRNTTNNTEGGSKAEEYRHASVVDRVNTTMQVWMGTTYGCAQCHSHKYDPFSQKEYYQVFAIFNSTEDNNSEPPVLETAHVGRGADRSYRLAQLADAKSRLDLETRRVDERREEWEKTVDQTTLPKEIGEILAVTADQRIKEQLDKLTTHHRKSSAEWMARQIDVNAAQAELDQVATTTLVMKEGPARPTHVAIRGEFQSKGAAVVAGVPAVLHQVPTGTKLDRLAFAQWIVAPENPLTARVAANRLWQEIFGIGLVESSEEFGNQGEPPSHPELLDWLATEYVRTGWDTKQLLRQIVTSAAYRQSSQADDELTARDPFNRLVARGPRIRLPAETVRDQALFVAGLLSPKMYGPPVHPPQPINGLAAAFGPSTDWETSRGEDRHRRALYTRWRRNLPYPSMITFDAPERSVCSLRRTRTNTPLQALVTLNDQVYVEAAQALARRILLEGGGSVATRASYGFRLALTRQPTDEETQRIVALYATIRAQLAAAPAKASSLATKPIGPLTEKMDVLDAAAWTVVGNVLLNLDEFLAKP